MFKRRILLIVGQLILDKKEICLALRGAVSLRDVGTGDNEI